MYVCIYIYLSIHIYIYIYISIYIYTHTHIYVQVLKIVKQGFNRNFGFKEVNKNALTMYGKGVYFALNASYSSQQRYSKPNSAGEQQMFACRVLVGEYSQGRQDQPTPDVRQGAVLYDSTVDDVNKPEIFVVYHDAQA